MTAVNEFVHLHVHSQYSMLDGAIRVRDLVARAHAAGMRAVALTDHANMFGAITAYKAAKEVGIQLVLGAELDVVAGGAVRHLPLLAATEPGYRNLVRLVSMGHVSPPPDAPPGAPCVALDTVAAASGGLVALTGCMGGIVAQAVLEEGEAAGRRALGRLREAFEPGHLFVELQDHGLPEQPVLNRILVELARAEGLPVVATNDVHYATRDDAEAQTILHCIKTGRTRVEQRERHHGSQEMYLKSPLEMAQVFGELPEALANTARVAEMCKVKLELGKPMLPSFAVPDGYDTEGYFRHVAREGFARRLEEAGGRLDRTRYENRLEMELGVICQMKFAGYFLIVWDFIRHAKERGIPVGPGRGSGAGSIVAWSMRITDLDPIPYNLLFERFLNPERVSMPDFDVDFCMDRRDEVIAYVQQKYGEASVGQIATFAELKAKSVIKDVGRALGFSNQEAQQLANLVPRKTPAETYTITESLAAEPKLKARYDAEPGVRELCDLGARIEGLTRHAGKHAAGIVISEGPLWDHVPVFRDDKSGAYVTQYYKDDVEAAGLVKFDFLGLKTLTVLDVAVRLVRARPDVRDAGRTFELASLPLDDKATYALLASGETKGVFQLESSGMQQLFKDLRADCFEDIVAAVALYRPGPLESGMVPDFVARKHGRKPIGKMHPLVDPLLEPTYGVIVYQEQVMQIAQALAGYTLGGADVLRRAMGKKKPEEIAKQRGPFLEGAEKKGVEQADAARIFELLEYFGGYGFNKCVVAETEIVEAATGERTTVGDLVENPRPFEVHALGEDGKLRARRVTGVASNGRKRVYELRTAQGKRVVATGNHPFRTLGGWTHLERLRPGDRVAAPRSLPVASRLHWPAHELVVLAGLLSEGDTCHPTCLHFFGDEPRLVRDFAEAASRFPHTAARTYARADGRLEACVSTGRDTRLRPGAIPWNAGSAAPAISAEPRRSGVFEWARELGVLGKSAPEKSVPAEVFRLSDADVELLLGRLWAGGGFLANATQTVPSYSTSSERLARDVQLLLARLGIVSGVRAKSVRYRGGARPGYTVHVLGDGCVRRFAERVAPHCVGREAAVAALGASLARLARFFPSARLAAAADSDIFWDRVVSIRPAGVRETYDLTVEADHNFVADGLVVHNSHSAAYALLTYQTAYLKAHYPVELLCAIMTSDKDRIEKVVRTIADARAMGATVLPPDLNESDTDFKVVYAGKPLGKPRRRREGAPVAPAEDAAGPQIRFGLGAVRGVGGAALEAVFEARASGPFRDLFDFAARVDAKRINKAVLESLVACGAFDQTLAGIPRSRAYASVDVALERSRAASRDREVGQTNLFGLLDAAGTTAGTPDAASGSYVEREPWDSRELLARERQALGFYVSGHPLDRYLRGGATLARLGALPSSECAAQSDWAVVKLAGVVEGYRERIFKDGKIAFFDLEDRSGRVTVRLRGGQIDAYGAILKSGEPVLLTGKVSFPRRDEEGAEEEVEAPREPTILLNDVVPLADAARADVHQLVLRVDARDADDARLGKVRDLFAASKGDCPVVVQLVLGGGREAVLGLGREWRVEVGDALFGGLERIFGAQVAELR